MEEQRGEQVCVVGAGGAGLAAAQALAERGLPFTVFEAGSGVGGNWRFENDSGRSSAYDSLRANVSRQRTRFSSLPMPKGTALFPTRTDMVRYMEEFTDRFGLREHIRFRTEVAAARPLEEGGWEVVTEPGGPQRFRAVIVASGYNSIPQVPELPGSFDGLQMHSHDYRTPDPFAGKDAVVLGMGCSATELACEIAGVARSVTLAARSGADVTGRRIGLMPIDWLDSRMNSRLPWTLRRRTMRLLFRLAGGNAVKAGLPPGPERCGDKPVAISDELVRCVRRGKVAVGAPVTELRGDRVVTADGAELPAQAILYGTGYRTEFPFLPDAVEPPSVARADLYRGVASPVAEGLFFIGIAFTLGALIPVFEAQASWTVEVLAGRLVLPSEEVMRESIRRDSEIRRRDFDGNIGFAFDRVRYQRALEAEAKRAARRPGSAPRRAEAATLR